MSLLPPRVNDIYRIDGVTTRVNSGLNTVRFVAPVLVGSRVRASVTPRIGRATRRRKTHGLQNSIVIEIESHDKPACLAEGLTLLIL